MIIGLTGGLAAGKSIVAEMLMDLGAQIICADTISRVVVAPNEPGSLAIRTVFGDDVFFDNGRLDRRKLADIVFNDDMSLKMLNQILHPIMYEKMQEEIASCQKVSPEKIIVLVVPILIESDLRWNVDEIWVVEAPEEMRVQRAIARDHLTREEILQRLKHQLSDEERLKAADRVIHNTFSFYDLRSQVRAHWNAMLKEHNLSND